ncbi:MAG: hypothetical protein RR177_06370 [Oscillospiraceae bacterium]
MADKNRNKTVNEQRRAQQELLELKKMQQGSMPIPGKPSDDALVPTTVKQKNDNFWFYHKYHVIAAILVAAVLAVTVYQFVTKEKYDCTMVLYMSKSVGTEVIAAMESELEKYCEDTDKNGKVNVLLLDCAFSKNDDYSIVTAKSTRLQAQLATPDAMLFITDQTTFDDLNHLMDNGLFSDKDLPDANGTAYKLNGTPFDEAVNQIIGRHLEDAVYISKRKISGTAIERKKHVQEFSETADKLLENLTTEYAAEEKNTKGTSEN